MARALRLGRDRDWIAAGLACGIGLENKQTVAVLILGCARRPGRHRAGGSSAGRAVAGRPDCRGVWVPNLAWDATHSWANLQMAASEASGQGGPLGSLAQLPSLALLLAGILAHRPVGEGDPLAVARSCRAPHRWLLAVPAVAVVVFTGGRRQAVLLGSGFGRAVRGRRRGGRALLRRPTLRRWRRWPATLGLSMVTASLIALPVFPPVARASCAAMDQEVVETYGWPQFTAQVAAATRGLPPDTVVFTSNYGEAGRLRPLRCRPSACTCPSPAPTTATATGVRPGFGPAGRRGRRVEQPPISRSTGAT